MDVILESHRSPRAVGPSRVTHRGVTHQRYFRQVIDVTWLVSPAVVSCVSELKGRAPSLLHSFSKYVSETNGPVSWFGRVNWPLVLSNDWTPQ